MPDRDTQAFLMEVYPLIENSLNKNLSNYRRCVGRFIEARLDDLNDTVPISRTYFGTNDINDFFDSLKIDKKNVTEAIDHTYYRDIPKFNPAAARDEFSVAMISVIRYFILNKMTKETEMSAVYLAFSGKFYTSIHSRKFMYNSDGKYNRHIMEYVVNYELSGKYDLKREGSVHGAVRSICSTWLASYTKRFTQMSDEDVVYLIQQLHNRIKSFLGNIAEKYYEAVKDKKYIAYSKDTLDDDNKILDDKNDSLRAEKYVEIAMAKISSMGVDQKICAISANQNVKITEVKSIIESIVMDNDNIPQIKELVRLMIISYMENSKFKDVVNPEFLARSITPKPNTKDPKVLRQKEIVEFWLNENSPAYRKRKSREATAVSYHKSVMSYFAWTIYNSNKNA